MMRRTYWLAFLPPLAILMLAGCGNRATQIRAEQTEMARRGAERLHTLAVNRSRQIGEDAPADQQAFVNAVEKLADGLMILLGRPVETMGEGVDALQEWHDNARQLEHQWREEAAQALTESDGGGHGGFGLAAVGIASLIVVGLSIYVWVQYGKWAGGTVGALGLSLLTGYVFVAYKTYILYGALVLAIVAIIVMFVFLMKEQSFSKMLVGAVQRVRDKFQGSQEREEIDAILEKEQDRNEKVKVKRLKRRMDD